ncbi:MAG: acyl-CoA dehydrogenase family protein [Chloroflexi bacterium]|nr:acyl-CoA dehydrogenase family protein [Chloroflexota bacterium]
MEAPGHVDFNLSEKQNMLRSSVREFSDREIEPFAAQIEKDGRLPDDLIAKLAGLGMLGMTAPQQYGGAGESNVNLVLAIEQLSYSGAGAWWLAAMNNSIPACMAHFGSEYIKARYVPPLCKGDGYASIQFTEDDTGSDPEALKTQAVPSGDRYVVSGAKRFITFGARDGYAMLFAKDEDGKCTAFVIEKNTSGYSADKTWALMGAGGIEATDVHLENLAVARDNMLGAKGKGFGVLLWWIAHEKVIQCAANVGMAQAATDEAVRYARSRLSRGKPIADMQGIRWMLGEMDSRLEAARWLTYRTAFLQDDLARDPGTDAAKAKLFVVPATISIVESARQVHGAYGYTREFKIERLCRAVLGATCIATSLELNKSIVGASVVR